MSKTGIELLEDICERLDLLTKRFAVIEHNTKQILSRMNISDIKMEQKQILEATKEIPSIRTEKKELITIVQPEKVDGPTISKVEQKKEETSNKNNTRVMSKLKRDNKMLAGVFVKIINKEGAVVRETKTNRSGEWQCFLVPGQYKAEYFLENVINDNVNFMVTQDQQLLRIPMPA